MSSEQRPSRPRLPKDIAKWSSLPPRHGCALAARRGIWDRARDCAIVKAGDEQANDRLLAVEIAVFGSLIDSYRHFASASLGEVNLPFNALSLQIEDDLETGRLFDRQIRRLGASQDLVHIGRRHQEMFAPAEKGREAGFSTSIEGLGYPADVSSSSLDANPTWKLTARLPPRNSPPFVTNESLTGQFSPAVSRCNVASALAATNAILDQRRLAKSNTGNEGVVGRDATLFPNDLEGRRDGRRRQGNRFTCFKAHPTRRGLLAHPWLGPVANAR